MMEIEEFRLWPENMSLIRYPDDMPAINGADIEAFDKLLKFIGVCVTLPHKISPPRYQIRK